MLVIEPLKYGQGRHGIAADAICICGLPLRQGMPYPFKPDMALPAAQARLSRQRLLRLLKESHLRESFQELVIASG